MSRSVLKGKFHFYPGLIFDSKNDLKRKAFFVIEGNEETDNQWSSSMH